MRERVGEKHITNEGYVIEIVEFFKWNNYTIKFEDGIIIKNKQYSNIKGGRVKNLYHKSIYGVGYFGVGNYNNKTHLKIYVSWQNMLERCYDLKYQDNFSTYIGCLVDEHWHNFQVFGEWFEDNYNPETMHDWHLDKDILVKGNKMYSPKTCCFLPQEINLLLNKSKNSRGGYPIGVSKKGNKFQAQISVNGKREYLGTFNTTEEAFQAYKTAKEKYIKEVAEKYQHQITEQTYQALINYKVEITD